jgi:transcriptional regulator with XRE-family HTH domain
MIADRFRELRRRHALTQRALAQRASLSMMCICLIEQGLRDPMAETIRRVCRATGADANWLLEVDTHE